MESIRSLIRGKIEEKSAKDEEVFVEEIKELLKPHLRGVYNDMHAESGKEVSNEEQYATEETIHRLLHKFFNLAKQDASLNKFMFPIMMYLRKARNDRKK